MSFLGELLAAFLSEAAIKALARKTGLRVRDLRKFLPVAVPFLIKILTKNASSEEGAGSLLTALAQHTDDKPVDKQIADADIVDGAKIINHILGRNEPENLKSLSRQSKLSETAVSGILSSIAPALLTYLSKAVFGTGTKRSSKSTGLAGLLSSLTGSKTSTRKKTGLAGLLSGLSGSGGSERKKTGITGVLSSLFSRRSSTGRRTKKTDDEFDGTSLISALLALK